MGADKNSSPKRELGLCPKYTTKDSHTSLLRSRSHNGPPTLGTNPKQYQNESETQGAKNLAALRNPRRTVRDLRAERPCGYDRPFASYGGPSEKHSRTTSTAPSIKDHLSTTHGPSSAVVLIGVDRAFESSFLNFLRMSFVYLD
jgi:hypothetical protein